MDFVHPIACEHFVNVGLFLFKEQHKFACLLCFSFFWVFFMGLDCPIASEHDFVNVKLIPFKEQGKFALQNTFEKATQVRMSFKCF
jgi:hypothetical protein